MPNLYASIACTCSTFGEVAILACESQALLGVREERQTELIKNLLGDGVVVQKPTLDMSSLCGEHDTLPSYQPGPPVVLSHEVRPVVEYVDNARLGMCEVKFRGWSFHSQA